MICTSEIQKYNLFAKLLLVFKTYASYHSEDKCSPEVNFSSLWSPINCAWTYGYNPDLDKEDGKSFNEIIYQNFYRIKFQRNQIQWREKSHLFATMIELLLMLLYSHLVKVTLWCLSPRICLLCFVSSYHMIFIHS